MIEIPREKLIGVGEQIQDLAKSKNSTPDGWAGVVKEFIENIPQGVAMVKEVINDVKQIKQAENNYIPTKPYYESISEKKEIIPENKTRAENIFNQLVKQGEKYKSILSTMKGNKLFELMKKNKEMIVNKIKEELEK